MTQRGASRRKLRRASARAGAGRAGGCARAWSGARVEASFSSSLTRRIVSLNLGGLLVLVRRLSLAQPFPRRHHRGAHPEPDDAGRHHRRRHRRLSRGRHRHDPARSRQAAAARARRQRRATPSDEDAIEFSINPEKVGPVLHRLVTPTHTRARIYDRDGALLLDSQTLSVARPCAPTRAKARPSNASWRERLSGDGRDACSPRRRRRGLGVDWIDQRQVAARGRRGAGGQDRLERSARQARRSSRSRCRSSARTASSGALLLSTQGRDIDKVIAERALGLLRFFRRLAAVMLVLSLSLANTIAEPVRKLADAADRVRRGIKSRQPIPDFTNRADEIGHLSRALGDMTEALYSRIDAIESFAADVAHELKNPLTSLRSARGNAAAGENRSVARPAAADHPARRAPARPADQRHLRRLAPRRGTRARRREAGRRRRAARRGRLDDRAIRRAAAASSLKVERRADGAPAPISCSATIRASRR